MEQTTPAPLTDTQRCYLKHIQTAEQAGQSLKAYAAEHDVSLPALYSHKAVLRKKGHLPEHQPTFAAVRLSAPVPARELRIHLPNGMMLEVGSTQPTATIVALCQGLLHLG
jgi:hypothetical protein